MRRPTIKDLAQAANVSIATVNRVLGGAEGVTGKTRERVETAAQTIGFYGLGAIQSRNDAARPRLTFGFLLLQPHRSFYQLLARALRDAAAEVRDYDLTLQIEFLEDLSPQNTAAKALELAGRCQSIGITSAVHPLVSGAIQTIQSQRIPVFAVITQLSATGELPYVGLDNWKVGRTAAWAMQHICKSPGKIGILLGNYRYRNQEMNESGFRSYFREHGPTFTLLEPLATFEAASVAQEMTEQLLRDHPDLTGLYVSGGGISGALAALRASERRGQIVVVGYDLMDATRTALLDGTMTFLIAHPLRLLATRVIDGMIRAVTTPPDGTSLTSIVPFEIYTSENL